MSNAIGTFGHEARAEVDYYLDRRLQAMTWNSYGDQRAWHRAAAEFESQLAKFRAEAPVSVVQIRGRRVRTFKSLRTAAAAALLTLGLASMMASSAQAATPDVQSVEAQTSKLPAAVSPQAAEANQRQVAPAVKAAIAAGHGRELLDSTSSPDVRADLLRYGGVTITDTHAPPSRYAPPAQAARRKVAHAAGCYGSPWSQTNWTVWGSVIGWLYVRENGWCGQSGYIYWYGGATFASWAWGPYCFASKGADYSWEYYPSWIHMAHWGSLGVSYPWGCLGASGGKVQIRIAWNGYWDEYNDYGF